MRRQADGGMSPVAAELVQSAVEVLGMDALLCLEEECIVNVFVIVEPIDEHGIADVEGGNQIHRIVDGPLRMGKGASKSNRWRRPRHVEWFVLRQDGVVRFGSHFTKCVRSVQ